MVVSLKRSGHKGSKRLARCSRLDTGILISFKRWLERVPFKRSFSLLRGLDFAAHSSFYLKAFASQDLYLSLGCIESSVGRASISFAFFLSFLLFVAAFRALSPNPPSLTLSFYSINKKANIPRSPFYEGEPPATPLFSICIYGSLLSPQ